MLFRIYLYDEKVLLPTVAQTEQGLYVDTKPVQQFAVTDLERWKSALYLALNAEAKRVDSTGDNEEPGSILLEILQLQKWSVFEKRALMYTVHAGGAYIKVYRTGKGPDGMWNAETTIERIWDVRTPMHYIVDAVAEDAIQQPEAHPIKAGGLMLLPKPSANNASS